MIIISLNNLVGELLRAISTKLNILEHNWKKNAYLITEILYALKYCNISTSFQGLQIAIEIHILKCTVVQPRFFRHVL